MNDPSIDSNCLSDKLVAYLRAEIQNPNIDYQSPPKKLQGGYETSIYRFQLSGVDEKYSQSLVLRLYPKFYGSQNAIWESSIQNMLANAGYPAAKVHFLCTDMSILGGAFFIMDHIPGQPLIFSPPDTVPDLMGNTHAELHQLDPKPLINKLWERGVDEYVYRFDARIDWFKNKAGRMPWIMESVRWLLENRPPEPEDLSVCHGDFHALNIMAKDGVVTGVLDWGGFAIADPVFDVANTIVLTTIPAKHLSATWDGFPPVDWDLAAANYLAAYQTYKDLNLTNLDYYRVRRCLLALVQGFEGQQVWQHPLVRQDLIGSIKTITGMKIVLPE